MGIWGYYGPDLDEVHECGAIQETLKLRRQKQDMNGENITSDIRQPRLVRNMQSW